MLKNLFSFQTSPRANLTRELRVERTGTAQTESSNQPIRTFSIASGKESLCDRYGTSVVHLPLSQRQV